MPSIPTQYDPTLRALENLIQDNALKEPKRNYLGASLIGDECARSIYYSYHNAPCEPFKAKTLWAFEDGHRTEDLIASRLRMLDGIELWSHDENTGNQFEFIDFEGKFKGHPDGIIKGLIQAPKALHIWECKACADKKYNEFLKCKDKYEDKDVLKNWNKNYFVQAQILMHYFEIDRHYTTVSRAGGREIVSCRTEYNGEVAERYRNRAKIIIDMKAPPPRMSERKDLFKCKWCRFRETCHGGE